MKKTTLLLIGLTSLVFAEVGTKDFKFLLDEEKIKKVHYNKNFKKLIVQVVNDGTNRNGYAQYVGMEINSHKLCNAVDVIYIKDILCSNKKIENGECSSLGKVRKVPNGGYI